MAKSYWIAFMLWLFFGLFGGHHFYLNRDRHGIIHLFTFGGFVIGWLWDIVKLRSYVQWANFDEDVEKEYAKKVNNDEVPGESFVVQIATTVLGQLGAGIVLTAIPSFLTANEDFKYFVLPLLTATTVAFIIYYLGNIGDTEGSFMSAMKGSLLASIYYYINPGGSPFWCVLAAKHTFVKKYRLKPEPRIGICRRILFNALTIGLVVGLGASYFVYNCEVETDDGETVSCVDSVRNFFNSAAWNDLMLTMRTLYNYIKYNGWGSLWKEIVSTFDMAGTDKAIEVLGVTKSSSEQQIKAAYKKLARQYHPDKVKDPQERQRAEEKFIEIQKAYELLSKTKNKRHRQNQRSRSDEL